jgi:dTDP-4-amino-4,6-dideoxygalactose transaminase
MPNPYKIVEMFEQAIADYSGSKYAVAIESCTMAVLLCLKYKNAANGLEIEMPKYSYPGVANSILHAGGKIKFTDEDWGGIYQLRPLNIIDGALRFKRGMYEKGMLHCLSFHVKKRLSIGRGSAILTDDLEAAEWLRLARFDGRRPIPLKQDSISVVGYNAYMQPDQAARGLQILQTLEDKDLPDLPVFSQNYSDLSLQPAYQ